MKDALIVNHLTFDSEKKKYVNTDTTPPWLVEVWKNTICLAHLILNNNNNK